MTRTDRIALPIIIAAAAIGFCAMPIIDKISISTVADAAAYETCWNRNGAFFPSRWSCESTIRSNIVAYAFACASRKDPANDFCVTLERIEKENDELRRAAQAAAAK